MVEIIVLPPRFSDVKDLMEYNLTILQENKRIQSRQWENNFLPDHITMQKWDTDTMHFEKQDMSLSMFLGEYAINPKILVSDINLNFRVKSKLQFYIPARVMRAGENVLQLKRFLLLFTLSY